MTAQSPPGGMRKSTIPTDRADERVPSGRRRALDGHDAEAERGLAGRPAAHQHLAQDRVAEHDERPPPRWPRRRRPSRRAVRPTMRSSAKSDGPWMRASMSAGDRPRRDAGRLELEHDGLRRDDAARGGGHAVATVPAATSRGVADTSRGRRPLHHHQPGQLAPTRAARPRRAGRGAPPAARPRSTSWCSSTSGRRRTCPTPAPSGPTPRWSPASPALVGRRARRALRHPVADRWPAVARFFTTSFPAAVWHARRFVLGRRCSCSSPAVVMGVVAGALRRGPRGRRPRRRCARPTSRRTSRRTTRRRRRRSSPRRSPSTTSRSASSPSPSGILLCVVDGVHPRDQRGQRRPGRRAVRRRRPAAEVLRADPPARAARAVRHRRGRRRRAGGRLGDHRPRRPHPRPRRWPSRVAAPR